MKSLAERHIDRAQRKADNAAESTESNAGGNIGAAAIAVANANAALAALTSEQRDELRATIGVGDEEARSFAEDESGALSMAGIGVVNPLVIPVDGFDGLPKPSFDPAEGNLNGQAVQAASTGWAAPVAEETAEDKKAAKAAKAAEAAEADKA